MELGKPFLVKMEIDEYMFGEKHGKLVHLWNLVPKITYGVKQQIRDGNDHIMNDLEPYEQFNSKQGICNYEG